MSRAFDISEFEKLSKKEWIEDVRKYLKENSLESYYYLQDPNLKVDPFTHHHDQLHLRPLKDVELNKGWSIGEPIDLNTEESLINEDILRALEMGANALVLDFPKNFSPFEKIFKGVDLSIIQLNLRFPSSDQFLSNPYWLGQKKILNGFVRFKDKDIPIQSMANLEEFDHLRFYPCGPSSDSSIVSQLAAILEQAFNYITAHGHANKLFAEMKIGKNYFMEISKLRAFRILIANLMKAMGKSDTAAIPLICFPNPELLDTDPFTNMISTTTMIMSGVIGGADMIYTPFQNNKEKLRPQFQKRIARNIQNILMLESYMNEVNDPSAGSIYIEKITESLVMTGWSEFKKRISVK